MFVTVYDEGKKNELIGEGILRLYEVIDKGELDVWFLIKNNGVLAGDIYFELTFYAVAPPPVVGAPTPHTQVQHPSIRYTQPGYMPAGRPPPPHASHVTMYGTMPGPPGPFPGNIYQHPTGIHRAYPVPQGNPFTHPQPPPITIIVSSPSSFGVPNQGPALNNSFGPGGPPPQPFQPKVQYNPNPNNNMSRIPQSNFAPQGNSPGRHPTPQPQPGMHNPAMRMPVPHPTGGQNIGCRPNLNGKPNQFPNDSHHDRRSPGPRTVTPPVRYK
ncbi:hypothetical protein BGZ80_004321 [Entomortierella chlamydospora]|uniref:C2 domain-containing protein n=1 Tax=Entomortierella chlamydospora TaxID=101097 RepID=A0A9P6MMM7_9FUNG|nr:hypothetical protein BGZ79_002274 [Entomortierella chlamydospora]KAG0007721.1 hypothetical protein BGZ80_004321 [Entomortierella chlamydospora]